MRRRVALQETIPGERSQTSIALRDEAAAIVVLQDAAVLRASTNRLVAPPAQQFDEPATAGPPSSWDMKIVSISKRSDGRKVPLRADARLAAESSHAGSESHIQTARTPVCPTTQPWRNL
jgi:hypothetical protein